jgi:hypothetical protein
VSHPITGEQQHVRLSEVTASFVILAQRSLEAPRCLGARSNGTCAPEPNSRGSCVPVGDPKRRCPWTRSSGFQRAPARLLANLQTFEAHALNDRCCHSSSVMLPAACLKSTDAPCHGSINTAPIGGWMQGVPSEASCERAPLRCACFLEAFKTLWSCVFSLQRQDTLRVRACMTLTAQQ